MNDSRRDECPICYQKFVLALELTCNHTFCFLCIKGVHEGANGVEARCPLCRTPIDGDLFKKPKLKGSIDLEDPEEKQGNTPTRRSLPKTTLNSSPLVADVKKEEPDENEQPKNVKKEESDNDEQDEEDKAKTDKQSRPKRPFWLYQANDQGWWRFDPRAERDMEENLKNNAMLFDLIICGHAFRMDLSSMTQTRLDVVGGRVTGMVRNLMRVKDTRELANLYVKGVAGVRLTN